MALSLIESQLTFKPHNHPPFSWEHCGQQAYFPWEPLRIFCCDLLGLLFIPPPGSLYYNCLSPSDPKLPLTFHLLVSTNLDLIFFLQPPVLVACAETRRDFSLCHSSLISQIRELALLVPLSEITKQITTGLGQPSVTPKAPTTHRKQSGKRAASDACAQ